MMVKEAVRVGYNDLAELYYQEGFLQDALKMAVKSRDYCSTSRHIR